MRWEGAVVGGNVSWREEFVRVGCHVMPIVDVTLCVGVALLRHTEPIPVTERQKGALSRQQAKGVGI